MERLRKPILSQAIKWWSLNLNDAVEKQSPALMQKVLQYYHRHLTGEEDNTQKL